MLTVGRKSQAGQDIFAGKVRKVCENLLDRHFTSQITEHIVDRDAHAPNARLTAAFAGLKRNDVSIVH